MTDYPIPDELRDQFVRTISAFSWQPPSNVRLVLDTLEDGGAHIELRLPEFAVHDGWYHWTRKDER